ncbi:MAG: hypothetical protein LBI87_15110, partial [Candidatus Accumulibacter sp.]|nr:hypothetical protein [Accumulibacter sp.]
GWNPGLEGRGFDRGYLGGVQTPSKFVHSDRHECLSLISCLAVNWRLYGDTEQARARVLQLPAFAGMTGKWNRHRSTRKRSRKIPAFRRARRG